MALLLSHFVVAVLLAADVHLRMRQPGLGVNFQRRKRIGNRRQSDVRGLGVCGLFGWRPGSGFICGRLHAAHRLLRSPWIRANSDQSAIELDRLHVALASIIDNMITNRCPLRMRR